MLVALPRVYSNSNMQIGQIQKKYYGNSGATFDFFRDLDITLIIHLGIDRTKIPPVTDLPPTPRRSITNPQQYLKICEG